jgi:hypothetical protein
LGLRRRRPVTLVGLHGLDIAQVPEVRIVGENTASFVADASADWVLVLELRKVEAVGQRPLVRTCYNVTFQRIIRGVALLAISDKIQHRGHNGAIQLHRPRPFRPWLHLERAGVCFHVEVLDELRKVQEVLYAEEMHVAGVMVWVLWAAGAFFGEADAEVADIDCIFVHEATIEAAEIGCGEGVAARGVRGDSLDDDFEAAVFGIAYSELIVVEGVEIEEIDYLGY